MFVEKIYREKRCPLSSECEKAEIFRILPARDLTNRAGACIIPLSTFYLLSTIRNTEAVLKIQKNKLLTYLMLGIDALTVAVVFTVCYRVCWLRVLTPDQLYGGSYLHHLLLAVVIYTVTMLLFRVGRSLWRFGQAQEYFLCCIASFLAGFLYFVISRRLLREENRIVPFYFYALVMCAVSLALVTVRLFYRMLRSTSQMNMRSAFVRHRAILLGELEPAAALLAEIGTTQFCNIHPVAVIPTDGKPAESGGKLFGIPLRSAAGGIPRAVRDTGAELIVLLSAADGKLPCLDEVLAAGCRVTVAPRGGRLADLRDLTADEILGGDLIAPPAPEAVRGSRILLCGASDPLSVRLGKLLSDPSFCAGGREVMILGCGDDAGLSRYDREELDRIFRDFAPDVLLSLLPRAAGFEGASARVAAAAASADRKPERAVFVLPEEGGDLPALTGSEPSAPDGITEIRLVRVPSTVSALPDRGRARISLLTDGEAAALILNALTRTPVRMTAEALIVADCTDAEHLRGALALSTRLAEYSVGTARRLPGTPLSARALPALEDLDLNRFD